MPANINAEIDPEAKGIGEWLRIGKKRFSEIEYNDDDLCLTYRNIEIVKSGIIKVDPFNRQYIGEKGVDIALAVKMIALGVEKKCDKIILISGDYDYAEALKYVKNNMAEIHIVKIHKGIPPQNKSVSRDWAVLADGMIDVYGAGIRSKFLLPLT